MTELNHIELISFRICPFVVRTQIVAQEKGLKLKTRYIDLNSKPDWFLEKSPTGTVPALFIGDSFIFESSVITDFIDEQTRGTLYPADIIKKYQNKSWIEYATKPIVAQYQYMISRDKEAAKMHRKIYIDHLLKLEMQIKATPFFNGVDFSVIDAVYAPLLYRFLLMGNHLSEKIEVDLSRLENWAKAVVSRLSVKLYLNKEFDVALLEHLEENQSWLIS